MGILSGAEMTTFEMRFIALRCKDTIAPTGTLAQGVGARQVNSFGEIYESKYGITTSERVYGTIKENLEGRGPCYLQTEGITPQQDEELKKAYLNMAPSQTLKWIESGKNPSQQNVEIEGTEPYIVGGHTASGYWIDTKRRTTIGGLYAAGDVAGGCPQKYVTGALVEGEIAALTALEDIEKDFYANKKKDINEDVTLSQKTDYKSNNQHITYTSILGGNSRSTSNTKVDVSPLAEEKIRELEAILNYQNPVFTIEQLEEAMQKVMDTYAGGISVNYQFNENQLAIADEKIDQLRLLSKQVYAEDMHELMFAYELKERLVLAKSVIAHLRARKETRWHSFAENLDYPYKKEEWLKYVNSRLVDGELQMIYRELVGREDIYEHTYK
jgi:adenylylsulfate reductase subunit A